MDSSIKLEELIKEVMESVMNSENNLNKQKAEVKEAEPEKKLEKECERKLTAVDYPLAKNSKELIKTKSGKGLDDITVESVLKEQTGPDDIKITAEVLLYQAQVAESVGRYQFAGNLRRAAELTKVPDQRVLEIYNALRPYRSTKQQLLDIADELENKYSAKINAKHVRDAAEVYEKRGRLME